MLPAQLPAVGSFYSDLFVRFEFQSVGALRFLVEEYESNKLLKRCVSGMDLIMCATGWPWANFDSRVAETISLVLVLDFPSPTHSCSTIRSS